MRSGIWARRCLRLVGCELWRWWRRLMEHFQRHNSRVLVSFSAFGGGQIFVDGRWYWRGEETCLNQLVWDHRGSERKSVSSWNRRLKKMGGTLMIVWKAIDDLWTVCYNESSMGPSDWVWTNLIQTVDVRQRFNVSALEVLGTVGVILCVECGTQCLFDILRHSVPVNDHQQGGQCRDCVSGHRYWNGAGVLVGEKIDQRLSVSEVDWYDPPSWWI